MPKFSIIIPVYNVEKYIKKCLDSVFNQTYKDYEVIVVNDESMDKSIEIAKKYKINLINQKNMGLSEARNNGIKQAKGEYLIFLDSDDYIEKDLLKEINKSLVNNPDIVRYQVKDITELGEKENKEIGFNEKNGQEAFELISKYHYVEPAWLYAVKRNYYLENNFKFKKGTYHEDFGLIPLMIIKSKKVNSIEYCGYCYVKRNNSIMNNNSYEKTLKKVEDTLKHYDYLMEEIEKIKNIDSSYFKSFISNSVILKILELKKEDYKKYLKILKEKRVFDNLLDNSLSRKIKKNLIKISPKFYYTLFGKR